jgi:hypothetical protein
MNERRGVNAEVRHETGKPSVRHRPRDDKENRRPRYQQQRERGGDEQAKSSRPRKHKHHDHHLKTESLSEETVPGTGLSTVRMGEACDVARSIADPVVALGVSPALRVIDG